MPGGPRALGQELRLALTAASGWTARRVLKSAFCTLEVPEIGLEASAETLAADLVGARDLLRNVYRQLTEECVGAGEPASMAAFLADLTAVLDGRKDATLVLRDPSGLSLVEGPPGAGAGEGSDDDPFLVRVDFEPTEAERQRIASDVRN